MILINNNATVSLNDEMNYVNKYNRIYNNNYNKISKDISIFDCRAWADDVTHIYILEGK